MAFYLNSFPLWKLHRISGNLAGGWGGGGGIRGSPGVRVQHEGPDGGPGCPSEILGRSALPLDRELKAWDDSLRCSELRSSRV